MIAVTLALLQATPAVQAEQPLEEIEVLGSRLRKMRLDLAMGGNQLTGCRVSVSSGDRFIDGQACKGAYACVFSGVTDARRLLACVNDRIVTAVQLDKAKND